MKRRSDATLGTMRPAALVLFLAAVVLSACSSGSASSTTAPRAGSGSGTTTTAPRPGSLNVSSCNYVQAWYDDPTHFTEFGTLAALARKASNSSLQNDGKQLASAAAAQNTPAVGDVMGRLLATCRQLGLVRTVSRTNNTTG